MSQASSVSAFRARCVSHGYTDVSIERQPSGDYLVSAVDPLFHETLSELFSEYEMSSAFRVH